MSSDRKIAANRRNAQRSTGPRSPAGKTAVALNRLSHGLYAATLILPGEDPEQYQQLHDQYQAYYQPRDIVEQELVDQLAAAKWRMFRTALLEAEFMEDHENQDLDRRLANLNRITQCQARLYRQWDKLRKDLDAIRAARAAPAAENQEKEKKMQPENDDSQWATPEEWARQQVAKPKNYKPPKRFELTWRPDPDGPEKVIARIYKGKNVDRFPDED